MSQHDNSLIKTPRQLITVIALAFIVPVILISLLATYVVRSATGGVAGSDAMGEKAIAERMRPVGVVAFADSSAPKPLQTGEAVYAGACSACHATGAAGAPRMGDAAAWAPRIKQGFDLLVKHAVEGFKAMPPKGGNSNLDPIEVARAVAFIGNQSGGKFKEPAAPASSAAPPAAATAAPAPSVAAVATVAPPPPPAGVKGAAVAAKVDGAKVYASGCNVCHAAGVAGAPKFGDKAAWAPRLAQGIDGLTASVIKGKGAMPPRGALPNVSDAELRAAVEHIVAAAK
ncbi:MAG TPA: c-type cytochrome [Burkholderiaceae bacterium]|nr:c-type cytochrome [Burkholderiaceae bacterium]